LGTRVVVPGEEGLFLPAVIQAVKTAPKTDPGQDQTGSSSNSGSSGQVSSGTSRYSVRFDLTRKVREYPETDIIGPGFAGITGLKLRPGQIVYVTYCNREMQGSVVVHRPNIDQVIVRLLNGGPEVKKKLEEVRLLESRKSARLIGHGANTDFSKLADFNIVHERKRLNSETSDMSSGTTSGRKRRGSDTLSDSSDEGEYGFSWSSSEERSATPVMGEVSAAMVLMNLSHAQMASKEATAMQQRMMQFMQRRGAAAGGPPVGGAGSNSHAAAHALTAVAAAAAEAVAASRAAEDTQNSPQDLSTTSILSTVPSSSRSLISGATPPSLAGSSASAESTKPLIGPLPAAGPPAQYAPADSPPILDGSSSPMSSTSGASSLGSSWTPPRRAELQPPSPPTPPVKMGMDGPGESNRATHPTQSNSSVVSQQQVVANLTEAEALLQLSNCQESDEGIVSDQSSVTDPEDPTARRSKTEHVRIIYQCTWPRCGIKMDICSDMERHVRSQHLMKPPASINEDLEGEEEFYFTEIEVPLTVTSDFAMLLGASASCSRGLLLGSGSNSHNQAVASLTKIGLFSTSAPAGSMLQAQTTAANHVHLQSCLPSNLADHMDMARPPHENPEYNFAQQIQSSSNGATGGATIAAIQGATNGGVVSTSHAPSGSAATAAVGVSVIPRPSPAHHQPRRPLNYPPLPPPTTAFSSITAAVPIAIPVTNLAFSRSAPPAHSSSHPHGLHHSSHSGGHGNGHNGPHHGSATSGGPAGGSGGGASGGKYIRLSPKPGNSSSTSSSMRTASSPASAASAMASLSNSLLTLHQQQQSAHPPTPGPPGPPGPSSGPLGPPQPASGLQGCGSPGGPAGGLPVKSSPIRRPRGDAKKCRKVYGMDHRDLWCTQCKWKKACTRFGEAG